MSFRTSPLTIFLIALLMSGTTLLAQNEVYSHGDPTNEEQYMLELVNRARSNPGQEGILVIDTEDPAVQSSYQYWQINKTATKQAFTTYPQRPPLAFHPALITAARKHTADMIEHNFQGHVGSDGSQLNQRFSREGYTSQGMYGENVGAYSNSVWFGHCGLIVDWGTQNQIELGHRRNILNFDSEVYTEIGIGITYSGGGLQQGTVGPYVITQDFGLRSVKYIVGVCYADQNKNGEYDPGEGLAGVRIQPSKGTYYAITSSSGGYAIPFSGAGSVTIVASGGGLTSQMTKTVDFSNESIKVDFSPAAQVPGIVTLKLPANNATQISRTNVVFEWNVAQFASGYEAQIATANTFTPASIIHTENIGGTTITASVPECSTKYYWRVRGVNEAGNGAWSAVYSFTTGGKKAASPTALAPTGNKSVDYDKSIHCIWGSVSDATKYHIRFSTQANMQNVFFQDSTLTTNSFDLPASVIPQTGSFYWTVRSINDCGGGTWAALAQINATITSVDEEIVADGIEGPATIEVVNLQGAVVAAYNTTFAAGMNKISVDYLSSLANGVYFVVVSQDGVKKVVKSIVK